jgi:hypothetical protein
MAWIGAIIQGVSGGIQMGVAMDQLSKLPSAKTFSPATDLETATSMARRAAQQGMTPQERAAAEQAIGTAQSRTQRAMEQRGLGNLAAAVSQIRTTEAMNQLEAQNQAIKRQSLGQYASLAGQMQSIQNQNIQSFNQMLYAQQQALGQAAQAGFKNLAGTGATIAEAIEGKEAIDDETIKDPVTTGQMGVTDTTAMPSVTSDSLLPTQDISEAPAIPSGAGSPGITSTSVLGPDGLPMQAPTQTSFQLPTETLGTPEIPSFELYLQRLGTGGLGTSPLEGSAGFDAGAAFGEYMTAPSDNYFTTE